MKATIVPTTATRRLAARIVAAAAKEGADAARLVAEVDAGQEAALVGALACIAARYNASSVGGRPSTTTRVKVAPAVELIACGRCGAKIHEPCRTEGGWSRADHAERLTPRRCPCGGVIPKRRGRDLCDACREAHRRAQRNAQQQRRRGRPRSAV
jgi:hypothetical protein